MFPDLPKQLSKETVGWGHDSTGLLFWWSKTEVWLRLDLAFRCLVLFDHDVCARPGFFHPNFVENRCEETGVLACGRWWNQSIKDDFVDLSFLENDVPFTNLKLFTGTKVNEIWLFRLVLTFKKKLRKECGMKPGCCTWLAWFLVSFCKLIDTLTKKVTKILQKNLLCSFSSLNHFSCVA